MINLTKTHETVFMFAIPFVVLAFPAENSMSKTRTYKKEGISAAPIHTFVFPHALGLSLPPSLHQFRRTYTAFNIYSVRRLNEICYTWYFQSSPHC